VTLRIDSDQHLVEYRGLWEEYADPAARDDAIRLTDDEVGNTWVTWRDKRLSFADVQTPGETDEIGQRQQRARRGEAPLAYYDDELPLDHWDPAARREAVRDMGFDAAVLFPNFGLTWERKLSSSLPALHTNMAAWNRWCAEVVREGGGALHPVAHLTLRDPEWTERQLRELNAAGVKLAMVAPALVNGKPLSHPDLDSTWRAFVENGVSPVFHVADQERPFDDAWYTGELEGTTVPALDSVFLYAAAALACTDLILNGVFEQHPGLKVGIVELSAVWVPMYLMMLDGGFDFTKRLNGRAHVDLARRPSEYFREHVRVSSFSYELPQQLQRQLGGAELLMACSDYPHSEGTAHPLADYAATGKFGVVPEDAPGLFGENAGFLLDQ
jgi:predicted TIM-barrel fold metal-dependent hydrolase